MQNTFASGSSQNTSFIIKNTAPGPKKLTVMGQPIQPGQSIDLMKVPGIGEAEIRASLVKGELQKRLASGYLTVVFSDIDLTQYNSSQQVFLKDHGVNQGINQVAFGDPPGNGSWSQTQWYIDPANVTGNASDANKGDDPTKPLLTWGQVINYYGTQRPVLQVPVTWTFLSPQPDQSDPIIFHPYCTNGCQMLGALTASNAGYLQNRFHFQPNGVLGASLTAVSPKNTPTFPQPIGTTSICTSFAWQAAYFTDIFASGTTASINATTPILSGNHASITATTDQNGLITVIISGLTDVPDDMDNKMLVTSGCGDVNNNGGWIVFKKIDSTSILVENEFSHVAPLTDPNNGNITWEINGTITISGLTGMSPSSTGNTLVLSNCENPTNNQEVPITQYLSPTSVIVSMPQANIRGLPFSSFDTSDLNNGSIHWEEAITLRQPMLVRRQSDGSASLFWFGNETQPTLATRDGGQFIGQEVEWNMGDIVDIMPLTAVNIVDISCTPISVAVPFNDTGDTAVPNLAIQNINFSSALTNLGSGINAINCGKGFVLGVNGFGGLAVFNPFASQSSDIFAVIKDSTNSVGSILPQFHTNLVANDSLINCMFPELLVKGATDVFSGVFSELVGNANLDGDVTVIIAKIGALGAGGDIHNVGGRIGSFEFEGGLEFTGGTWEFDENSMIWSFTQGLAIVLAGDTRFALPEFSGVQLGTVINNPSTLIGAGLHLNGSPPLAAVTTANTIDESTGVITPQVFMQPSVQFDALSLTSLQAMGAQTSSVTAVTSPSFAISNVTYPTFNVSNVTSSYNNTVTNVSYDAGAHASINVDGLSDGNWLVTGLTNIPPDAGSDTNFIYSSYLNISGCANSNNNGIFQIKTVNDSTSVIVFDNGQGASFPDTNDGNISWVLGPAAITVGTPFPPNSVSTPPPSFPGFDNFTVSGITGTTSENLVNNGYYIKDANTMLDTTFGNFPNAPYISGGIIWGGPVVVETSTPNTIVAGDNVGISGVVGATVANGVIFVNSVIDSTHFTLNPVATGTLNAAYVSGGLVNYGPITVTTATPNNLLNGQYVTITGVTGTNNANVTSTSNQFYSATVISNTQFNLVSVSPPNLIGDNPYTGDGYVFSGPITITTGTSHGLITGQLVKITASGTGYDFIDSSNSSQFLYKVYPNFTFDGYWAALVLDSNNFQLYAPAVFGEESRQPPNGNAMVGNGGTYTSGAVVIPLPGAKPAYNYTTVYVTGGASISSRNQT